MWIARRSFEDRYRRRASAWLTYDETSLRLETVQWNVHGGSLVVEIMKGEHTFRLKVRGRGSEALPDWARVRVRRFEDDIGPSRDLPETLVFNVWWEH